MRWFLPFLLALGWSASAVAVTPCGPEAPCAIAGGDYYLAFPEDWDGVTPLPALVFFHGHRSSGLSVVRSGNLHSAFADRGYLIVAPNGALMDGSDARAWPARPTTDGSRDDVAFTLAVLDDVAARVPLDQDRIYAAGFSAGGSMAYMLACYQGQRFAGFVSISGALRRPIPDGTCPGGPVRMLHFHGYADAQVPLEGRGIRDWHQGDVFESLDLLRRTDQCATNPSSIDIGDPFWCRTWTGCGSGRDIEFCLHDGGHEMPRGWADVARDWMEQEGHGS
jgi:polyhydroxybutyrate depolymerase